MIRKRITSTGEVRYDVVLRRPDRSRYTRTFRTRKDAERYQREELTKRDRGEWVDPTGGRELVRDVAHRWLDLPGRSPKTVDGYRQAWARIEPRFGALRVGEVRKADVQRFVRDLTARGYSPHTVRGTYSALRAIFNLAVDEELIGRTPCAGIDLPSVEEEPGRALEPEELERLADAFDPRYRAMVWLGGYMGLRVGEMIGLQVRDLDLHGGVVHVRRSATTTAQGVTVGPPKTRAGRRSLPLPGWLIVELGQHLAGLDDTGARSWVFPAPHGGVLQYKNWRRRIWVPATERAGLAGVTPHDLRRTAATLLVSDAVDLVAVQAWMGHEDSRMTLGLYARLRSDGLVAAADALERMRPERPGWTHSGHMGPETHRRPRDGRGRLRLVE